MQEVSTRRGFSLQAQGSYHGHFCMSQFQCKLVFFQNLHMAPPLGTVELENHGLTIFQQRLINPVFKGIELKQPPIAIQADKCHGIQHRVRCQIPIGGCNQVVNDHFA